MPPLRSHTTKKARLPFVTTVGMEMILLKKKDSILFVKTVTSPAKQGFVLLAGKKTFDPKNKPKKGKK